MCTRPKYITPKGVGFWYYKHGIRTPEAIPVPCGKCPECLRKRQNSIAARIYEEAKHVSEIFFVTLTYRPEDEPWSVSLWSRDLNTGEEFRHTPPVVQFDNKAIIRCREVSKSRQYNVEKSLSRIIDLDLDIPADCDFKGFLVQSRSNKGISNCSVLSDVSVYKKRLAGDCVLFARYTPTLYLRDVQLAIKKWRVRYKREFGTELPEFKYVCFGEYGESYTRRPHYHMLLISKDMTLSVARTFIKSWDYGSVNQVKAVPQFNPDGTNACGLLSRYVSKYVSKGECASMPERLGCTLKFRAAMSHKLGMCLPQQVIDYYTCQDLKRFDQNNAESELTEEDKKVILPEVIKRMRFKIYVNPNRSAVEFALPVAFKKQIFNYHKNKYCHRFAYVKGKLQETEFYEYSELFYMAQSLLRDKLKADNDRKFRQFCASFPIREGPEVGDAYEALQKADLLAREEVEKKNFKRIYSKRKHLN